MTQPNPQSGQDSWFSSFLKELVSMPRRHMIVFFISATLLVLLEVELTEGWHVVHILEVLGALVFLYLLWTAWPGRKVLRGQRNHFLQRIHVSECDILRESFYSEARFTLRNDWFPLLCRPVRVLII